MLLIIQNTTATMVRMSTRRNSVKNRPRFSRTKRRHLCPLPCGRDCTEGILEKELPASKRILGAAETDRGVNAGNGSDSVLASCGLKSFAQPDSNVRIRLCPRHEINYPIAPTL